MLIHCLVLLSNDFKISEAVCMTCPLYFLCYKAGRLYDDSMIFKCNQQNFPDLPEWLRFTQRHPLDNGFLYGTPTSPGKSIIEV